MNQHSHAIGPEPSRATVARRWATLTGLLVALVFAFGGAAAAGAAPRNCAGGQTSLHTSHTSCLDWMSAGGYSTMVGKAIYGFYPSEGFAPSHVKQCWLYKELKSSYHTIHTVRDDCTAQAREGGLGYESTTFWGVGRSAGDTYWQTVWMVISTGVATYSSGPEAARVRTVKP